MVHHIRWCPACEIYTLKEECPKCGGRTATKAPPRYSPQDRYGKYRRMLLKEREIKEAD